jgi:hypothetical protein
MTETDNSKSKRGRPPKYIYPINCEFCDTSLEDRNAFYYHRDFYKLCVGSKSFDMSAVEKKIKAGEMAFPITTFNPTSGISAGVSKTLVEIQSHIERETKLAIKRRRPAKEYIKEGIEVCFEEHSTAELNKVKNYLSERRIDYAEKQEQVRDRIDTIVEACGLVVGQDTFTGLIGTPANYTTCMEKLLINHIRQRTMEELEASEGLIEAIYVSIKQTKVFRQVEATMEQFEFIEELLEEYLHSPAVETASFIHSHGQMASQDFGSLADDLTDIN